MDRKKKRHQRPSELQEQRILHTIRRARERHGLYLSEQDVKELGQKIRQKEGTHIKSKSGRLTVWTIDFRGHQLKVFYDKIHKIPVTILSAKGSAEHTQGLEGTT